MNRRTSLALATLAAALAVAGFTVLHHRDGAHEPSATPTAPATLPKKHAARGGGGKPFPKVEILYNTLESHKQIAEALAEMWQKELGVTVGLANTEWKVYLDDMDHQRYDLARGGWVWDYNDPHNMFECWTKNNGNNRTGWANAKYDALMAKAMLERDNLKRWEIYHQAERILCDEECPILPIYFYVNKNMVAPKVKGWEDNVLNVHPYDAIWIEKDGRPAPSEEQRLVFNNGAEPETLDPAVMSGVPEHHTAIALFEGLTRLDAKDLHPVAGVAESWEISEDGKTYTFKLRANAKWSNGEPLGAKDFLWSWLRVIDPKGMESPAKYAEVFDWIDGAKPFIHGEAKAFDASKVGISAKDDHTLVVKLAAPCPFFLSLLAFPTYSPVHRATVEKHGLKWTREENIVGNGPFVLQHWRMNEKIVFVPNQHYWGRERVKLQEVTLLPIDNQDTGLNKFIASEVDWIDDVPIARAEEVTKHPAFRRSPFLAIYFYRFNCSKPPFDDARVRRAFSMSVDKKTICSRVQRFGEIPANGAIPRGCGNPPYESAKGAGYDPDAARQLLRDAGYETP